MVLRMASPIPDKTSGIFYFRVRVPTDLLARIKGQTVTLPVGEDLVSVTASDVVKLSLRTRDPRKAKTYFVAANAALSAYWESIRKGPRKLYHKEAVALSGEVYRAFTSAFEDEPGSYERWATVLDDNEAARTGSYGRTALMIGEVGKVDYAMERRFGPIADAVLRAKGLVIDDKSRHRVMVQVGEALDQAAHQLKNYADGDYTADPKADRFGEFQTEKQRRIAALTISGLFDAWEKEATHLHRAKATINRYRSVFTNLRVFLKHDDATKITAEDLVRFKDARLAEGISGKTIKDGDLAALKSVLGWAAENKRLPSNPAAELTVRVAKRKLERERGFNDQEAKHILKAALAYSKTPKESAGLAVAKKWVPWLCAFTGSRVSEVTALRKESFRSEGDVSVVRIFGTKTGSYRDVPLHPQLEAVGLLNFVRQASSGPLFYSEKDQKGRGPESQSGKLAKWVRSLGIDDPRVQPNHGWRHRFTTVSRAVSMDHEKREYIVGHRLPGLGSVYGDMAGLSAEIGKLPWYEV
ncbi:DUF6538 domain-containing protein [Microvirga terricola]|uniref:Site-specific integrase n=1 Tax=Microvirga terricola TaxID=2719797 RepID=A0ABX0VE38_9HYPH|nr:DUF6538 domain-containing protein [Microvirga terricola]NIX78104.1 site-specific integrase [Microvirga terricola]